MGQYEYDLWKDGFTKGCIVGAFFALMLSAIGVMTMLATKILAVVK